MTDSRAKVAPLDADRHAVVLTGDGLTLEQLVSAARGCTPVAIDEGAYARIDKGRRIVERIVRSGRPTYGVNTGFGSQKDFAIPADEISEFNRRVLVAHATHCPGAPLSPEIVRATLVCLLNQFAIGCCGVRRELVDRIVEAVNGGELPTVSWAGSVGQSDLVPMGQIAMALLGGRNGAPAFDLAAKEALSLMNSNSVSKGWGGLLLQDARRLLAAYDLAAAVSLEGFRGNLSALRIPWSGQRAGFGQVEAIERLECLLRGSALHQEGAARFLQDPLSYRCINQIHGPARYVLQQAEEIWRTEINLVNDNPVIDLDSGTPLSHGNMDTTTMTFAMDALRQLLGKVSVVACERIHKQQWPAFSGLPTGLSSVGSAFGGVQFLNLGHIAAAITAMIVQQANPVLLTHASQVADGVEDVAGYALHAVSRTADQLAEAWKLACLEIVVSVWAVIRRQIPLDDLGVAVRRVVAAVGPRLPIGDEGRQVFDLEPIIELIRDGSFLEQIYRDAGSEV